MKLSGAILFILLFNTFCFGQLKSKPFVIKLGLSHATQQWGYSPFDHIRPIYKSIQSGFAFIGYKIIRKDKLDITAGIQYSEKGFRVNYFFEDQGIYKHELTYQYLLQYLEVPIIYTYHQQRFSYTTGIIFSYLLDDVYSVQDKVTLTNTYTNITTQQQITYETSFNKLYNRINKYDVGIVIGTTYKITENLGIDFTLQKHFLNIDNWKQRDLVYNLVFLLGLKVEL